MTECSLYGIRIYREGSVLATHVDRLPLVSSAIINVDQDLDEPWPLEVYGHDGRATNVTMEPGKSTIEIFGLVKQQQKNDIIVVLTVFFLVVR